MDVNRTCHLTKAKCKFFQVRMDNILNWMKNTSKFMGCNQGHRENFVTIVACISGK